MPDLQDVIRFENEHTALDFKAVQYRKEAHEALLKDVMAMANADVVGDRHIILGVKHHSGGTRDLLGVLAADFVDSAVYQELVRANIEPSLEVDYFGIDVDGKLLGVIRISGCENQPYLMKKHFGALKAGDGFIRKGSHQSRLTRADLDRIAERKRDVGPSDADLMVSLSSTQGDVSDLEVPALTDITLASDRAAAKIRSILNEREEQVRNNPGIAAFGPAVRASIPMPSILGGTPYHLRSDDELRKNLTQVKVDYQVDDRYELFEKNAFRLNIFVTNNGRMYVEDAAVELRIPAEKGLLVADHVYPEPRDDAFPLGGIGLSEMGLHTGYPDVLHSAQEIRIQDHLGAIKHHRVTAIFREPLRVVISPQLIGSTIPLELVIFGKNLPIPVRRQLRLVIVGQDSGAASSSAPRNQQKSP